MAINHSVEGAVTFRCPRRHWTNKKNTPAMENKGSVTPFCAMLAVESICWIVAQGLVTEPPKPKIH